MVAPQTLKPLALFQTSVGLWFANILVFTLAYWLIDAGGPEARESSAPAYADFDFPARSDPAKVKPGWQATIMDYLFLAFTTNTAFGPTEAMPLTARAKSLLIVQSLISLVTVAGVAARHWSGLKRKEASVPWTYQPPDKGKSSAAVKRPNHPVWRMSAYLRRASRIARLLNVAACGTLAGHALTYLLKGRTMDDGHHGYFSPLLAVAIASVLLCSIVALVRLVAAPSNGAGRRAPSFLAFYVTLATLQVAGFAALESFEGNPPDVIGCGIEALMALVIATFVFFLISFAERYVAPIVTSYLRRARNACNAVMRVPPGFVQPPLRLAVCAGICRFERPPPIIG